MISLEGRQILNCLQVETTTAAGTSANLGTCSGVPPRRSRDRFCFLPVERSIQVSLGGHGRFECSRLKHR